MRQFDIVRLKGRELAVILQSDILDERETRVVAPLIPERAVIPTPRLHPILKVGRSPYLIATEKLAAIRAADIDKVVGSAASMEYEIRRALDILFVGV